MGITSSVSGMGRLQNRKMCSCVCEASGTYSAWSSGGCNPEQLLLFILDFHLEVAK